MQVLRVLCWALLALALGGCVLTAEEKQLIVQQAAEAAGAKAYEITYEKLKAEGFTDEEARRVADLARSEAAESARKVAERAIPQKEAEKRSKWEAILAAVVMFLAKLGLGMKKGGVA